MKKDQTSQNVMTTKRRSRRTAARRHVRRTAVVRGAPGADGPMRQLSNMEVIMLHQLYDQFAAKSFEDAMADFTGLAELLADNTAPEVEALKRMVNGETELNMIRAKARAL